MDMIINALVNQVIKGGVLVQLEQFIVSNAAGELVGKKAHATREEAEAEMLSLEGYAEGLQFAKAAGFDGKAAVGKANVVAEYMAWVKAGKPETLQAPAEPTAEAAEGEQF